MEPSWITGAGRVALLLFSSFIAATLIATYLKRKRSRRARVETSRVNRAMNIVVEYLGNVDMRHDDTAWERRRNLQARFLIDHIKEDLTRREVPEVERERILEDLRKSMQPGEPGQTG